MGPLKAAVVSRHPIVLLGLRALLSDRPDEISVVDAVGHDGHLAGLDVVVYDLASLADSGGEDLQHLLRANAVVVGVARDGRHDLTDRAQAAGVARTFPLDVSPDELVEVLLGATADRPVPPEPPIGGPVSRRLDPLSERETEIIALVAAGRTNAEIGEEIYLGVNTVKTHLRKAYRKLGVSNRSQAIIWYLRQTQGASLFR